MSAYRTLFLRMNGQGADGRMNGRASAQRGEADEAPAGSLHRARLLVTTIARGSRRGSLLTELVARTGLPRPTIHRVLDMLIDMGWVERDPLTLRFNLGRDLAALGYSAISRQPVERAAATELSALAEELDQVVFLNIRSGLDSVCIGRYDTRSQIQVGRGDVGLRTAFGITQSCIAMMSRLPADEVWEVMRINLSRFHRVERYDEIRHRAAIDFALANGYCCFDGMWRILQQDDPDDYVLATGETHTVREFVERAFSTVGKSIEWSGSGVDEIGYDRKSGKEIIEIDPRYFRPAEVDLLLGNPEKARIKLGWSHTTAFEDLVSEMVESDMRTIMREESRNDFYG